MKRRKNNSRGVDVTIADPQVMANAQARAESFLCHLADCCESIEEAILTVEIIKMLHDDFLREEGITNVKIHRVRE